ncbi:MULTISPECIES: tRNA 2-selenouridine(34) synthase MnmH [unclassified Paenibacillus]|uniref:tRNA 2-selenouridine(34) synthase MnmH n=1 Tax=unclassified Paenibacillus TaxID=185978 RepID=UPI001C11DA35|nr:MULTISPECIES: tRNA 2-selenouridine(34) synthase MnmH [unclassified Paenibacillus]MBU5441564.1 tRNA 2-selenouridine(34) synthase MnmH [Paenibacillus sp. MSJ-34]CAH0117766.1 tRNA 2-selenouridine synthase [Paenibacillus sp. CECT 9249]
MFQDITIEQLRELQNAGGVRLIDVRSPGEFAEFTIPGSVNIPLFDDEERAEIGTIYKQISIQAAKDRGLEIVSAKLPHLVRQFRQIEGRKAVFCWRGGMRSKTTATVLSLMGIQADRLSGGIRAYRNWVVETLANYDLRSQMIVVAGRTGTGKTEILRHLAKFGYPVIELERLAQHRGSVFGHIGMKASNQKTFESLLVQELEKWRDTPYIIIEAESKRIGKAVLPDFLVQAKTNGISIYVDMPLAQRVRNIMEVYKPQERKQQYIEAFQKIKKRIHTPVAALIESLLGEDRFEEAISLLLEHYYDPRYDYAAGNQAQIVCEAADVADAASQVAEQIRRLHP